MKTLTTNTAIFLSTLTDIYAELFESGDPEYAYAKTNMTPKELATKMTESLLMGSGSKEGKGIRRCCKRLAVPYTYEGIKAFLVSGDMMTGDEVDRIEGSLKAINDILIRHQAAKKV